MTKTLVTGASGYLGWFVAGELARRGHRVTGTSRDGAGLPQGVTARALSLDDGGQAAAALIQELRPSGVIHCAATSDAGQCSRHPQAATRVNHTATGAIAQACAQTSARLLYTSTDLVFDGTQAPYDEAATPNAQGAYMASKLGGEREVLAASEAFLVARVALLYGRTGGRATKFTDVMVARLQAGEPVTLWRDQHRTPAEVSDAAALLCDLLETGASGIVHVGGPTRASRLELGLALCDAHALDPALCVAGSVTSAPPGLARPPDTSFDTRRLRALVGREALDLREGCARSAARA